MTTPREVIIAIVVAAGGSVCLLFVCGIIAYRNFYMPGRGGDLPIVYSPDQNDRKVEDII